MKSLADHFPHGTTGRTFLSRVRNALWWEIYPESPLSRMPMDWDPDPRDIARIDLRYVHGLGPKGRRIVEAWLKANGVSRP